MSDDRVAAEALREAADRVQAVFNMQCPPGPPSTYVDRGAYLAHKWWNTVLGGLLRDLRRQADAAVNTELAEHPTRARLRALIDQRRLDTDDLPLPVPVEELRAILDET